MTKNNQFIYTLFILLFCCLPLAIIAQGGTIQELEKQSKEGENRLSQIQAYNQLTAYYLDIDLARANRRNQAALQLLALGSDSAITHVAENTLLWEARIAAEMGDLEQAIAKNSQTLQSAKANKNQAVTAIAYAQLGKVYSIKGYPKQATEYLLKAIKIAEEQSNIQIQISCYHLAAEAYLLLQNNNQASFFLRQASGLQNKKQIKSSPLFVLHLGAVQLQGLALTEALITIENGLEAAKKQKQKRTIAYASLLLGDYYAAMLDWDEADNKYYNALQQYRKLEERIGQVQALQGQAAAKVAKGDTKKSMELLQQSLVMLQNSQAKICLQNTYKQLSIAWAIQKDYQQSLQFYQKYTVVKDSIQDLEKARAVADLQIKHNAKILKKEKEELEEKTKNQALQIELRSKELNIQQLRNNQNFYVIVSLVSVLGLALIIGFLILRQNGLKSKIRETELEQRALRSQMNPHFMFNSLNSIQSLIAIGDNAAASIYLAKFSKLVRKILQNTRATYIPMQQEIDFLNNYIELEQRRFKEAFDFEVDTDQIEDAHFVMIPPLVIQPFIENAIIHGLLRKDEKGTLRVIFEDYNANFVKCTVQDNGIGREAAAKFKSDKKHESLGIKITEQRLEYLTMKQKKEGQLIQVKDLKDEAGNAIGTAVEILLPIKYKA